MNAYTLSGFGCPGCRETSLQGATDYDQIKIGGKTYSAKQIVGKTITAAIDTKVYSGVKGSPTVLATIKAGQPIGIVWSYLRPEQADGRSWLMFEGSSGKFYYTPNEAVSSEGLKEQGVITVKEEVKKEQEEEMRKNDPVGYYLKKFGLPLVLIIGGIVVVKAAIPTLIDKAIPDKKSKTKK